MNSRKSGTDTPYRARLPAQRHATSPSGRRYLQDVGPVATTDYRLAVFEIMIPHSDISQEFNFVIGLLRIILCHATLQYV
jgi:hypothetical protein